MAPAPRVYISSEEVYQSENNKAECLIIRLGKHNEVKAHGPIRAQNKGRFSHQETRKGIGEEVTLEQMNKGQVGGHQTQTAAKRLPGRGNYTH